MKRIQNKMNRKIGLYILITLLISISMIQIVQAKQIIIYPTEDTYIDSTYPNDNFVGSWSLVSSRSIYYSGSKDERISLLNFNINLPSGSIINSAKLRLNSSTVGSTTSHIATYKYSNNLNLMTVTWNNLPSGTYQYLSENMVPYENKYYYWNILPAITKTNDDITLALKSTRTSNGYETAYFWSKNNYYQLRYPALIIDYSTSPSITVTSPNGEENWLRGTNKTIRWSYIGNPGKYVKIELFKAGTLNRVISANTSNDGSYNWAIASSETLGKDFKIKITSKGNSSYSDNSNNNFIISTIYC